MRRILLWFPLALLVLGTSGCHLWALLLPPGGTTPPTPTATIAVIQMPTVTASAPAAALPTLEPAITSPAAGLPSGKIVYTCQVFRDSMRNQICLVNADGSGQTRLTWQDEFDHLFPSFAPDGLSFVYSTNVNGLYQVYEMDLAGNQHSVIALDGDALAPAVSPDGSRLVFTLKRPDRQTIWLANRDGSLPHPVEELDLAQGWDPVWSPDGTRLQFASDRAGGVQLFSIGVDGSDLRQVTHLDGLRGRSDWSPDGQSLATYAGTAWQREIVVMDASGENPRPVTAGGNNLAPSFSPDGAYLAFTSYRDRADDIHGCEIYTLRLEDGAITRLTDNDFCDWQPRWGK